MAIPTGVGLGMDPDLNRVANIPSKTANDFNNKIEIIANIIMSTTMTQPESEQSTTLPTIGQYIDGKSVVGLDERTQSIFCPAGGSTISSVEMAHP